MSHNQQSLIYDRRASAEATARWPCRFTATSGRAKGGDDTCAKVEPTQMRTRRINVKASAGAYEVVCAAGALGRLDQEIARLGKFTSVQVVSSPKVWRAVG